MIAGAAVCPAAPLLVPGLAPVLASGVPEFVHACRAAVATLAAMDRVLLVTSAARLRDDADAGHPVLHPPGTGVTSRILTGARYRADFDGRLPGGDHGRPPDERLTEIDEPARRPAPGVGTLVGAVLLAEAGIDVSTTAIELGSPDLASSAPGRDVARELGAARLVPERVGLLLIAEGSASRGPGSPGGGSAAAESFDRSLANALADGSSDALISAVEGDRSAAAGMFCSGPAFLALAGVTAARPPNRTELLYDGAPLGVGYIVVTWSWD